MNASGSTLSYWFADKVRFFDEVLSKPEHRLFLDTPDDLRPGAVIPIDLIVGGTDEPVRSQARVIARRASLSGSMNPGVWINLNVPSQTQKSDLLQIEAGEGIALTGRGQRRFSRVLPALIDKPVRQACFTKNIGRGGACIGGPLRVPVGQTMHLTVDFGVAQIPLFARVAWRREDEAGVEFRFQGPEARYEVLRQIERISDETSALRAERSVLVVDDEPSVREVLGKGLARQGFTTLTAQNGPEALSIARACGPTLILLDVKMPGMDGLEVCRALKRDVGTSSIPVILSSALSREALDPAVREVGALGGLCKPYSLDVASQVVERALDTTRLQADRAYYESDSLRMEASVRRQRPGSVLLHALWGDPPGTRATLTLAGTVEPLEVEVTERIDWNVIETTPPVSPPAMGLRIIS